MDLPLTRREAIAKGETSYFTTRPCLHGHVAFRYTSSGACSVCVSDNMRAARASKEPPPELVQIRFRVHPEDGPMLVDVAIALTQSRHPGVTSVQVIRNRQGDKPMGGTRLYVAHVDPVDIQQLREIEQGMRDARAPDIQALRTRILGQMAAQADAARDNGETPWTFK